MKKKLFFSLCLSAFFECITTLVGASNTRTHLVSSLKPQDLICSYVALTPSNHTVNNMMINGYIHDLLLFLVQEALTSTKLSPEKYAALKTAESIFKEHLSPFLITVPVAQMMFSGENRAGSALENERREYQIFKK